MTVHEYIMNNWKYSIRDPKNEKDSKKSFVKLVDIYTTPCADDAFTNFYYWDTYFTNIGLLEDKMIDVVRGNINNMKHFVDILGYIPNADHLLFGSQPPFFTRAVYDLYLKTNDINDIKNYIDAIKIELRYWEIDHKTIVGLSQYKNNYNKVKCLNSLNYFANRAGGLTKSEQKIDKYELGQDFFAIGESGWDLTYRYETKTNRFDTLKFVSIDLNAILYDAEYKCALMLEILGRKEEAKEYYQKAEDRKVLINKYMLDKYYLDYNFVDNSLSKNLTVASLYPYAFNISNDKKACKELYEKFNLEYGISCGLKRKTKVYMQWDYPNMWPSNVYIAYNALKNCGLDKEAKELKEKYISTVDRVFEKTGKLWEKYDVTTGDVAYSQEYETPTMLGWTAGVYEYLLNN